MLPPMHQPPTHGALSHPSVHSKPLHLSDSLQNHVEFPVVGKILACAIRPGSELVLGHATDGTKARKLIQV